MKRKNVLIIILLLAGIAGMVIVEAGIRPVLERRDRQYAVEQRDPLTNDIKNALKFKTRYIGNASGFINLNYSLPLSDVGITFQIVPDELKGIINYKSSTSAIDAQKLKRSLVYNSTANFVLIDNLEVFEMSFTDKTYTISRDAVEKWYAKDLSGLQNEAVWKTEVRDKLSDESYVNRFIEENVK